MPKSKLCQVVAVVSGKKTQATKVLTEAHNHKLKPGLISGLYRSYRPVKEDGEQLPPEINRVQANVPDVIKSVTSDLIDMFDVVLTQDIGNTKAAATLLLGSNKVTDIPVTYLMFLEKQLIDIETFIDKLPVLDPSEEWTPDPDIGGFTTQPYNTLKAAKVYKTHVAHPPTVQHPAQVQTYTIDETVGVWTNVKKSGAIRSQDKNAAIGRVKALREAVKVAREEANSTEVDNHKIGDMLMKHIFGNLINT